MNIKPPVFSIIGVKPQEYIKGLNAAGKINMGNILCVATDKVRPIVGSFQPVGKGAVIKHATGARVLIPDISSPEHVATAINKLHAIA